MNLQQYLIDTFEFNDKSNKMVLSQLKNLTDPDEAVRLFCHLINSQYKWMARILQDPNVHQMDWWNPLYPMDEIEAKWNESLRIWIEYLDSHTEESLSKEVQFEGFDGSLFAATPADIALQLNYHNIHHRAQIQTIIRQQGLTPHFVDYIGQKYRRV